MVTVVNYDSWRDVKSEVQLWQLQSLTPNIDCLEKMKCSFDSYSYQLRHLAGFKVKCRSGSYSSELRQFTECKKWRADRIATMTNSDSWLVVKCSEAPTPGVVLANCNLKCGFDSYISLLFFFYLGFLSQPFTNHGTTEEMGGNFLTPH